MEKKIFNINVPIDSHRDRIDKFLQSQLNELSRTRLQNLIRDGHVKLNNVTVNEVSKKIKNEDKIEVTFPQPKETIIKPNKIPLELTATTIKSILLSISSSNFSNFKNLTFFGTLHCNIGWVLSFELIWSIKLLSKWVPIIVTKWFLSEQGNEKAVPIAPAPKINILAINYSLKKNFLIENNTAIISILPKIILSVSSYICKALST